MEVKQLTAVNPSTHRVCRLIGKLRKVVQDQGAVRFVQLWASYGAGSATVSRGRAFAVRRVCKERAALLPCTYSPQSFAR